MNWALAVALAALAAPREGRAMWGAFLQPKGAESSGRLGGRSSRIVVVRDGDRTTLTLSSDCAGKGEAFAWLIPVPGEPSREPARAGDARTLVRLERVTAPRTEEVESWEMLEGVDRVPVMKSLPAKAEERGSSGEYDLLSLEPREPGELETALQESGLVVPVEAAAALQSYIRQGMRFIVATGSLKGRPRAGLADLNPIQFTYRAPRFVLPILLGRSGANGPQDLTLYFLTRKGRVEAANYRTVKIPDSQVRNRGEARPGYNLPLVQFPMRIKEDFSAFYESLFAAALAKEGGKAVFTEYSAAADLPGVGEGALTPAELRQFGVSWEPFPLPEAVEYAARLRRPAEKIPAWLTKLRLRVDAAHFSDDPVFQETDDHQPFVPVYNVAPTVGNLAEAKRVADLTGWGLESIPYQKPPPSYPEQVASYWKSLWRRLTE